MRSPAAEAAAPRTSRLGWHRAGREAPPAARGVLWRYGPLVAGCFLLAWGVSFGWWLLLPGSRAVEVAIPPGTAEAVAAGRAVEALPSRLELRRGDTLVVRNGDGATHRIGTSSVLPGHTVRVPVTASLLAGAGLVCSFHPGGSIGVSPLARPGIAHTVIPTLLAGVPLALVLVLSVAVAGRLDDRPRRPEDS